MEFKDRLLLALQLRQMSAYRLAQKTGITRQAISLYTQGKMIPKQDQIQRMALALNVDYTYLLGITDTMVSPVMKPSNSLVNVSQIKQSLLNEIMSICSYEEEENLKVILSVVQTLAKAKK